MIYEMRTYDLKPRSLPEFIQRFGEAYEKRKRLSPLAAFWHTEIGPLNQVVHIWPYKDLAERARIRAEALAAGGWPPPTAEFVVRMQSEIYIPWPDSPLLPEGEFGPYFELRTYTLRPGDQAKMQKTWARSLPVRQKISPCIATWFSELGGLNKFVHIWPYKNLDDRTRARKAALETGQWPPKPDPEEPYNTDAQETRILLPAAFSPLR